MVYLMTFWYFSGLWYTYSLGIFIGCLVCIFLVLWHVYFVVVWGIFVHVLVCCTKKKSANPD
jgi:hypothetical protein